MTEKLDIASAARKLKSPNIKTRKRALKAIHDLAKQKKASRWSSLKAHCSENSGLFSVINLLPAPNHAW